MERFSHRARANSRGPLPTDAWPTYWAMRGSLAVRAPTSNGTNDSTSSSHRYAGSDSGQVSWMNCDIAHASAVPPMPLTPALKVLRPVFSLRYSGS